MFRDLAKRLYYSSLHSLSADKLRIRQLRRQNRLVVLNLHRVSPNENAFWPPLHPRVFEELLIFLKERFDICRFDQLSSFDGAKPPAVISFDDGYYDFIEYALPLLDKHGLSANMNIIPQCAISGIPTWNVRLYDLLQQAPPTLIGEMRLPGFDGKFDPRSEYSRLQFGLALSRFLKNRPRSEREGHWRSVKRVMEKVSFDTTRMMTTREIKQIAGTVEIGAHSFSHESMGFEESAFFEDDLAGCRDYFSEQLDLPLTIYAFPNGSYRLEQVDFLRHAGIKHILLVDEKFAERSADVFPRITIYGDSGSEVRMRSVGL